MDELLQMLLGSGHVPVRREIHLYVAEGPDGVPTAEALEGDFHVLSPEGSVDHIQVSREQFFHCGHSAKGALGGRCRELGCANTSCGDCFTRCVTCHKPLCLEHVARVNNGSQQLDFCGMCLDQLRRRAFWSRWTGGLLPPPQL